MYEPESDNETENIEEDTPESEFEEIEEEHEKNEQSLQYKTKKKATQQIVEKRKLKIFDYLNSEQDATENRN